jgi:hypothetical protein
MDKQKIGRYMIYLVAVVLCLTAVLKVVGGAEGGVEHFNGHASAPYILAVVQVLIAVAVFLPTTRLLGVILAASYFGGVIAFSWLAQNELPIPGIVLNTVLYAGAAMVYPTLKDGTSL